MIVIAKCFLSAATLCFAVGYAARGRANWLHRRLMTLGVALAWGGALVLLSGHIGLDLPLRPAYWLADVTGSARAGEIVVAVQQSLALLGLLVLTVQMVLGVRRHPLHRVVALAALPLWLVVWISSMFGYV